jgi:hypothetical protein
MFKNIKELLQLRSLYDFMNSIIHAMVHLYLKNFWDHGEAFEEWQSRFKQDGWDISDTTHGNNYPESEQLKKHIWRV